MGDDADEAREEHEVRQMEEEFQRRIREKASEAAGLRPMRKRGEPRPAPAPDRSSAPAEDAGAAKKSAVEEISGRLRDELAPKPRYDFPSAQRRGTEKELREDLRRVVETMFVQDVTKDWRILREGLSLGDKVSDHGAVMRALDKAEERAHLAFMLFVTAKAELERWELDNEVLHGAMWSEANRSLQQEKDDKHRSKQITDADIRARCATLFPEEWAAQEAKRKRYKLAVDAFENLAECWSSRCRSLQAILGKSRG